MTGPDVYAYGVIASSELHLLSTPFPAPDGYAELAETHVMTGGEALNSAIVLRRLGLSVRLDGNWIGDTPAGERLLADIRRFGIDARRLRVEQGFPGAREVVFSDERSRTIFGNYVQLLSSGRRWNTPQRSDIAAAQIVCVDPPFGEESALVGRYAVEEGVPFVSVDCAFDDDLSSRAAAVVVSAEFRNREYPDADMADLFEEYQARADGLVVFTSGDGSVLYGRRDAGTSRFDPYPVVVVDSAGAGDSFRAAVTYGLLMDWGDPETIRYAAALAGLVCERFPGVLNSPTPAEVEEFIEATGRDGDRPRTA